MRLSIPMIVVLTVFLLSPVLLFKPAALVSQYSVTIKSYSEQANVTLTNAYFPPIVYPGAFAQITLHNSESYPVVVYYVEVNGLKEATLPQTPVVIPPNGNVTIQVQLSVVSSSYDIAVYV